MHLSMKCPYCGGCGWHWVGVASNAYREECEECGGKGRGRLDWGPLIGLVIVLFSAAFILWGASVAFGQTAGEMTLFQFRSFPHETQATLLVGAMAATEHVGLVCPKPLTVGDIVHELANPALSPDDPWIAQYFDLITRRGCHVAIQDPGEPA